MVFVRLNLLILLLLATVANAQWHSPYCHSPQDEAQVSCNSQSQTIPSPIPDHILEYGVLDQGAQSLLDQIQTKVDEWGDFTRWLNGRTLRGSSEGFDERWDEYEKQARALIEVQQELNINKRRRDICYRGVCSAGRRVELEVEGEQLEKVKANLFSMNPWWLSQEFIELSHSENEISGTDLKKSLAASMANFFKQSFELRGQITSIQANIDHALRIGKSSTVLMSELVLRYNTGLEAILKRSMLHSSDENRKSLCHFIDRKMRVENTIDGIETTLEVGLIATSMLIGPESLLLMGVGKSVASRGLLAQFRAMLGGGSRASAYMADATFSAKMINDSFKKAEECREIVAHNQVGLADADEWENCLNQKSDAIVTAALSSVLSVGTLSLPLVRSLIVPKPSPVVFKQLENDGVMSIVDLSRKSEIESRSVAQLSDNYWDFVAETYRSRLNLTPEEITGFIQSSRSFEPRTKLVVMTRGPPGANKIEGGVAMVESSKTTDLMPFEKATGVKVPRGEGKVAEIVRLTAASDTNPNLMKDLLSEMAQIIKADPSVTKVYVYTSKIHARLYKRLGITSKQIGEPIDRDVILEIDASNFVSTLL
tara:strand:+ start:16041 stop:17834 length:1794 start_codon:yes stop_codon:yes gene_type:complete